MDNRFPVLYNEKKGGICVFFTVFPSPLGNLTLTSDGSSLTGLWMETQTLPRAEYTRQDTLPVFLETGKWLEDYFLGKQPDPDTLPLSPAGTEFQRLVWRHLLNIPYGQTVTYGHIAKAVSPSMSAQAIGGAVRRNPISIIIPCHRCIGANGRLTGYAGGIENKAWLLRHEEENK